MSWPLTSLYNSNSRGISNSNVLPAVKLWPFSSSHSYSSVTGDPRGTRSASDLYTASITLPARSLRWTCVKILLFPGLFALTGASPAPTRLCIRSITASKAINTFFLILRLILLYLTSRYSDSYSTIPSLLRSAAASLYYSPLLDKFSTISFSPSLFRSEPPPAASYRFPAPFRLAYRRNKIFFVLWP
ncbi:hypothetical protein D3C77_298370 [compost metagenome]